MRTKPSIGEEQGSSARRHWGHLLKELGPYLANPGGSVGRWLRAKLPSHFVAALLSYVVALAFDSILVRPAREVPEASALVGIDRPGGVGEIFAYYGLAAILVFVTWWALAKTSSPRLRAWRWLSAFAIVLASLGLSGSVLVPEVETRAEISGKAADTRLACYLFIRPIGSSRCWLQAPVALILGSDGTWRTQA